MKSVRKLLFILVLALLVGAMAAGYWPSYQYQYGMINTSDLNLEITRIGLYYGRDFEAGNIITYPRRIKSRLVFTSPALRAPIEWVGSREAIDRAIAVKNNKLYLISEPMRRLPGCFRYALHFWNKTEWIFVRNDIHFDFNEIYTLSSARDHITPFPFNFFSTTRSEVFAGKLARLNPNEKLIGCRNVD